MPRKLRIVERSPAVLVESQNGRVLAIFPLPSEMPSAVARKDALEHAKMLLYSACLLEAARIALGTLFHGNGSKQSVNQAMRFLRDAIAVADDDENLTGNGQ